MEDLMRKTYQPANYVFTHATEKFVVSESDWNNLPSEVTKMIAYMADLLAEQESLNKLRAKLTAPSDVNVVSYAEGTEYCAREAERCYLARPYNYGGPVGSSEFRKIALIKDVRNSLDEYLRENILKIADNTSMLVCAKHGVERFMGQTNV